MQALALMELIKQKVPKEDSWTTNEPYGFSNVCPVVDIKKVLYCVTPTKEVVSYFKEMQYDLLISHHPYQTNVPHGIFHTALDCCEGGLNDWWKNTVEIKSPKHIDKQLGWHGELEPIKFRDLVSKIEQKLGNKIIGQIYGNLDAEVKSAVVCSGLGGLITRMALDTEAECYITGELLEPAKATKFKFCIEVGHTLSEQMGVDLFKSILEPNGVAVDLAPVAIDRFGGEVYRGASI